MTFSSILPTALTHSLAARIAATTAWALGIAHIAAIADVASAATSTATGAVTTAPAPSLGTVGATVVAPKAASAAGISMIELILQASPVVQLVLLVLVFMSLWSWAVIFNKWQALRLGKQRNQQFERQFWRAASIHDLYVNSKQNNKAGPLELVFKSGMAEYLALYEARNIDAQILIGNVERAMQAAQQREQEKVEHRLSLLASIGSTAPYIGLLGTVWGIMHVFTGFSGIEKVSLAIIAPGIAEALVATAIGLFAAIPAVLAYNGFARDIDQLLNKCDGFSYHFINIIHRNLAQQAQQSGTGAE